MSKTVVLHTSVQNKMTLLRRSKRLPTLQLLAIITFRQTFTFLRTMFNPLVTLISPFVRPHAGRVRPETNALKPKPKKVPLGSNAILLAIFSWLLASSPLFATAPGSAYLYDDAGRLIQATISDGSSTIQITYVYDQAGNLTGVSEQHLN